MALVTIGILIYLAFIFDLFGFMARDEFKLRLLMLIASALYLIYFYSVLGGPLWEPIFTNVALAAVNLAMLILVVMERSTIGLPAEARAVYARLSFFTPGQFRRLWKVSQRKELAQGEVLTQTGQKPNALYYILSGRVIVTKAGRSMEWGPNCFIGEIAFLRQSGATADVVATEGAYAMIIPIAQLQRLTDKSRDLQTALLAHINGDLLEKVAASVPGFVQSETAGQARLGS